MNYKSSNNFKRDSNSKFIKGNSRKFQQSQYKSSSSNSSKSFNDFENNRNSKYSKSTKNIPKVSRNKNYQNYKNQDIHTKISNERSNEDLIWGKHSVLSALEKGRPINRIWCTAEIKSSEKFFQILKEFKSKGVLVEEVPWSRISQITFGAVHQGIALQISFSQTISLKELISISKSKESMPIILCLDGITDPHNVGAIVRSAEAFGCKGIILPQRRSAGITGTVAKVAAGALEHISICRVVNLNRSLQELKEEGFSIIGLKENAQKNISKFSFDTPLVIVVGSENKGLSVLTQKNCDYLIKIPLKGKTSSLNASVAAAVALHQLTKGFIKEN